MEHTADSIKKMMENRHSCAELASQMDLPLRRVDFAKRDYGDLAYHMDLPRSTKG